MSARKKNTKRGTTRAPETTPEPVADAPELRTDSEKALWVTLRNNPGCTAAELAGAAGIAGSTARRVLSGWASAGTARRDRDPGNPRAAERWTATTPAEPATPAEPVDEPETAHPEVDGEPGSDNASPAPESAPDAPCDTEPATGTPIPPESAAAGHTDGETTSPATGTPDSASDVVAGQENAPEEKLAPGALRAQVEGHLRGAPETEFTPHEIGKALGRSSGAVHNALVKLTTLGTARQTCERPKKFALAASQ
ncbi:hypothetical protein [Nocardia wallacei]|uniref:hypothetical protein n=1 Tax=Nocardia wallacei TaxID=480035 RepID=UPI002456E1BD|nr:hypothetical protein [Nocardia wallacei]